MAQEGGSQLHLERFSLGWPIGAGAGAGREERGRGRERGGKDMETWRKGRKEEAIGVVRPRAVCVCVSVSVRTCGCVCVRVRIVGVW